eukprot:Phypoly_transcript_01707.p1 GENE.Phypoly_transcript_01707~~Phypoly_transcript_01707.p1  ORF type:complete len:1041 (+),score=185.75 Phypoly_transcript_01707:70-3192(+)
MLFARSFRAAARPASRSALIAKRLQSSTTDVKRGKDREKTAYNVGDIVHGFQVKQVTPVPERNLVCFELEHQKTGAKHLHIDCDDTNNVFSATFKTTPVDSTGVAHILEHTTLCGSNKYPVRDPFFNMTRRSLNTYMNAWTASDYTSYPFSTQNVKDYYNLLSVYLDAVFYPKLDEIDFRQEGHRLEFDDTSKTDANLVFKGVVYNEMKGALSDPNNLFNEHLLHKIFPTTTYSHCSGGEPTNITDLTYEQLKNFHKTHYHPSNSWIFTYGDLPLAPRLKFIDENALSKFEKFDSKTEVTDEQRWSEPREAEITAPPPPLSADPDRQMKVSVAYLLNNITDPYETFVLSMLGALLTRGPSSPFYSALIDSNLGYDYAPGTGYDNNTREGLFSVGLSGVKNGDVDKVIQTIQETLLKAAEEGFPQERIESILHQIEFSQKNITANFGMQLLGVTSSWIHGGKPAQHIGLAQHIAKFREDLANGPFLQGKIKQYLLNNTHKLTLTLTPDEQYLQKQEDIQTEKLKSLQGTLTQAEKDDITSQASLLKERQEQKQDASVLPTLQVSDIPLKEAKVDLSHDSIEGVPLQWVDTVTNGITYFRAFLDLGGLKEDLRVYIPLFCSVLTEMGAGKYDHKQLAQEIDMYTSGIEVGPTASTSPLDLQISREGIHVHAASLRRNLPKMFELLSIILGKGNVTFENTELLHTLIAQRMSNLQDSISHGGSSYAKTYASSGFDRAHHLKELWGGMSQISFMQKLSRVENENELHDVVSKLQEIARVVFAKDKLRLSVVAESQHRAEIAKHLRDFINNLPTAPVSFVQRVTNILGNFVGSSSKDNQIWQATAVPFTPINTSPKTFFVLPSSVNYVAKCLSAVPYSHEDSAKLQILLKVMSNCYLHTEIREKGGAYGSGASLHSGIISFSSYRDPNVTKTIDVIDNGLAWVHKNTFSDQDITEAKISVFSDIDSPVPPSGKGLSEFYRGITAEMRQKKREELLRTERRDIIQAAEKYLATIKDKGVEVALGGEAMGQELKNQGWDVPRTFEGL